MKRKLGVSLVIAALGVMMINCSGCAGCKREWTATVAGATGTDWIVVQLGFDGHPVNAWKLVDVSVANESSSDGIWWQDRDGHLVHISGWYNRVLVKNGQFEDAAKLLGVDVALIKRSLL